MRGLRADRLDDEAVTGLFAPLGDRTGVGLAVSGGPDSLGLMLLAARYRNMAARAPRFIVYTVDHGLRPEAAAEVRMVSETAERFGLEARPLRWRGAKPESGLQSAARAARYRLMGEAMAADGIGVLVTAHHLGDQAETVLMRLAHGSGLDGLAAMSRWERLFGVELYRPLLLTPREALAAEVAAHGLVAAADPSNLDTVYERVRWRRAAPELAALGLDAPTLARFARRAGEAADAIDAWAVQAIAEIATRHLLGAFSIDRAGFRALPQAVAVRVLSRLLQRIGSGNDTPSLAAVERAAVRLREGATPAGSLHGCVMRSRVRSIWVCREILRSAPEPVALEPEDVLVWDGRFAFRNTSGEARFSVAPALGLTRRAAERTLGRRLDLPAVAIRSAPLVTAPDGSIAALGEQVLDARIEIEAV